MNINRRDWLIALLHAAGTRGYNEPVVGSVRIMKLLFLIKQRIQLNNFYTFQPYLYGPCSFDVYKDLAELTKESIVEEIKDKYTKFETFKLTTKGEKEGERTFSELPDETKKAIEEVKTEFNQMSFVTLLRYVYSKYPKYRRLSVINPFVPKQN